MSHLDFVLPSEDLSKIGLLLDAKVAESLVSFMKILDKWNKVYSITSVKPRSLWVSTHLYDSLSIAKFVLGDKILDMGSGGGFPGVPLGIFFPEKNVTLLDSNSKKTSFLQQVVSELSLKNIRVVTARAEQYVPEVKFDTVVSRAFSDLPTYYAFARPLCDAGGVILAMKGKTPEEEITELPATAKPVVTQINVPGLEASRCIVSMSADRNQ